MSDGTTAGTVKLVPPIAPNSDPLFVSSEFVEFSGALYFRADYTSADNELWRVVDTTSTGINPKLKALGISVYPNPAENRITVEFNNIPAGMPLTLELYDMQGSKTAIPAENLEVNDNMKHVLDLSAIPAGNYLLTIRSSEAVLGMTKVQKVK